MIAVVAILCAIAIALLVALTLTRRRLAEQLRRTVAADTAAADRSAELARTTAALEAAEQGAGLAEQRAVAAHEERAAAEQLAALAEQRAAIADERATLSFAGFDPEVVWALELARSERTWRLSVALGPDLDSVFVNATSPLREALQVEVDAAREEVGAVVELEAELPDAITPAGSVLVLRAAQELLATVVRRGEETTVATRPDGRDMLVMIRSVDENGEPVAPTRLPLPDSAAIEPVDDGVRIRNVVSVPIVAAPADGDGIPLAGRFVGKPSADAGYIGSMTIPPDDKNWTWVLERTCPECGFDAGSFDPSTIASELHANAAEWLELLDDDRVRTRPRPNMWSALEYGCHVRDLFVLFNERLRMMLEHDDPTYQNWDQDATAVSERYNEQDPTEVKPALLHAAEALADRFRTVAGDQWQRTGTRSDGAKFTVHTFAQYLIHDPIHHLRDVHQGYHALVTR